MTRALKSLNKLERTNQQKFEELQNITPQTYDCDAAGTAWQGMKNGKV
jgi:hypothetical protein